MAMKNTGLSSFSNTATSEMFKGHAYLDPTYAPAFRAFFNREDALVRFLNSVLHLEGNEKIQHLTYHIESMVEFRVPDLLSRRFDIEAVTVDGRYFDIEMQRVNHSYLPERMFTYTAMLALKAKNEYDQKMAALSEDEKEKTHHALPEIISVWICDKNVLHDTKDFSDEWFFASKNRLKDDSQKSPIPGIKYIIVELDKFNKTASQLQDEVEVWTYLLRNLREKQPEIPDVASTDTVIADALDRIRICDANHKLVKEQEAYMLDQDDINGIRHDSYHEGLAAGEATGRKKEKLEMVKAMLQDGLSLDKAAKYSGLSVEEIESLK